MRMSIRVPTFIVFRGTTPLEEEEVVDNSTLQQKLKEKCDRAEKRTKARERIENDLSKFTCAICIEKSSCLKNNPLCILACGHVFHVSCTMQLVLKGPEERRCPLCRFKIDDEKEMEYIS